MDEFLAASSLFTEVFGAALDLVHLHVSSCRCFAFVVQYVVALLVWTIIPGLFLGPTFSWTLFIGRNWRRIALYAGV